MRNLMLIFFCFFISLTQAQTPYTVEYQTQAGVFGVQVRNPEATNTKINGSPYLNQSLDFMPGTIMIDDSSIIAELMMRYNVYNQQFEIQEKNEVKAIIKNDRLKGVNISGCNYENRLFFNGEFFEKGFLEVVHLGKVSIYKRHECKIKEGYYNDRVAAGRKNDSYNHKYEYYLMTNKDQNPKKIKLSKKQLISVMQDKKDQVKTYIKENKIKVKRKEDLSNLLKYYETL